MRRLILAVAEGVTTTFIALTSLITTDADGKKTWRSDQSNFLEFRLDDFLVERFHDVFVRAGMEGARDMRNIVFSRAENDLRCISTG